MADCVTFERGELFVYTNGDRWELGIVKAPNNTGTGYFCWYHMGDTAANTPVEHMHKLENAWFSPLNKLHEARDDLRVEFSHVLNSIVVRGAESLPQWVFVHTKGVKEGWYELSEVSELHGHNR